MQGWTHTEAERTGMAKILIVDDSNLSRMTSKNALKKDGHEIVEAKGGNEALDILSQPSAAFDCMLLDLLMPETDGFEVLRQMRKMESSIPVVVQTADIQETTHKRVMELGARGIINKSFDDAELRESIQKITTTEPAK